MARLDHLSLKPMTVGNILDYTFKVYKDNFIAVLSFSALISGIFSVFIMFLTKVAAPPGVIADPWSIIIEGLRSGNLDNSPFDYSQNFASNADYFTWLKRVMVFQGVIGFLNFVYGIFVQPFVQGGITNITAKQFEGIRMELGESFRSTLKKFWRLVVTGLCLILYYIGVGIVFVIAAIVFVIPIILMGVFIGNNPSGGIIAGFIMLVILMILVFVALGIIAYTFIAFVYPVVISEDIYHFRAIGRSFKLVGKKFWRVFGVNFLVYTLITIAIVILGITGLVAAFFTPVPYILQLVLTFLITGFIMPIAYIAATILYYDIRVRVEGYGAEPQEVCN